MNIAKKIPTSRTTFAKIRTYATSLLATVVVISGIFFLLPSHVALAKQFNPDAGCTYTYEPGQIGYIGQCYGEGLDLYCDIPLCGQAGVDCYTEHIYCPGEAGGAGGPGGGGNPSPPPPIISLITVTITGLPDPNAVSWDVLPDPGDSGQGTGDATIYINPDPAGTSYTLTGLAQSGCTYAVTNNVNGSGPKMTLYPNATAAYNVAYSCGASINVTLSASPTTVVSGGTSNLTWTVSGSAASCSAMASPVYSTQWKGPGKSTTGGSQAITGITSDSTFYLTCYDSVGNPSNQASAQVSVQLSPAPATPTGLSATPSSCGTGTINVSWNSSVGASSYTLKDSGSVIYSGASTSFSQTGLANSSSHSYVVYASNVGGDSPDSSAVGATAPAACVTTATINVVEVGASGGSWYITPGFLFNTTSNVVTPGPSGTTYTITSNGAPSGYTVSGISSSDGGNTLNVIPGQTKQFNIFYTAAIPGSVDLIGRLANTGGFGYGPITIPSGSNVDVAWNDSNNSATCNLSSVPATSFSGSDIYSGVRYSVGPITSQTTFNVNCPGDTGPTPFVVNVSQADLIASPVTPSTATVGTPATFSTAITNNGNGSTNGSFYNQFTVANAANGSGTLTPLIAASMATQAGHAGGTIFSPSYNFPAAGTYSVQACADNTNVIVETNEANNCSGWTNVVVSNPTPVPVVTITANPTSGTAGTVNPQLTWSATNSPTGCTASGDWSGAKAVWGANVVQGVLNTVKTYTYTLYCTNGGGNGPTASATVTVSASPMPDLVAAAPTPTTAVAGTLVTLSSVITNNGNQTTGGSFFNQFTIATAAGGGGTLTPLTAVSMPTLANGSSNTTTQSYTFPSAGTYSVKVCADSTSVIPESNEANNCNTSSGGWTTVVITAPTTATLNVAEFGASGGTWTISPGGFTSTSNTVTPGGGGTTYSIVSNSAPAGYVVSSITSSDGGNTNNVIPGQTKLFSITYTPAGPPFNYSLSNSGDLTATKSSSNVIVQENIPVSLVTGSTQPVTLAVSGVPAGVSTSVANNPCSPNCTATISFTVHPGDPTGTSAITVTGSPLNKTTNFNLTINPAVALTAQVDLNGGGTAYAGDQVIWTCTVSGGTPPYVYQWTGTDFPSPSPTTGSVTITYQTVGAKTAQCTATDNNGLGSSVTSLVKTLQVSLNPLFKEF